MKLITWNVQVDSPWAWPAWEKRKLLLRDVVLRERPDIFCIQEAKEHQVEFLVSSLASYAYVGVGRDDGKERGEYCAILFRTDTFRALEQGTFWLSTTPERPSPGYDVYPRLCTWCKLQYLSNSKTFLVFNTHLPLAFNFAGKLKALGVVLDAIRAAKPEPVILAGDFNAGPRSNVWQSIYATGFQPVADVQPTAHALGLPLFCVDAIFSNGSWMVKRYGLLKANQGWRQPSDHSAVAAELDLR